MATSANYTVVVQVPLPWVNLNLNLNLVGAFVLPVMTAVGVPKALSSLVSKGSAIFQNVIEDARTLIEAIPDATVTIQVKVGPVTLYSVVLVAEKQDLVILPPTFQLALPNFGADAELNYGLPSGSSTTLRVPIPVPVVEPVPLLGITGGNVSAGVATSASSGGATGISGAGGAGSSGGVAGGFATGVAVPAFEGPTTLQTTQSPIYFPDI